MSDESTVIYETIFSWKFIIAPFICAIIGWLTNYIAVKMLFRPKKPLNFILFKIQGIFPKRQKALAENLGKTIEKNLISHEDIQKVITDQSFHQGFTDIAAAKIDDFINIRINSISPLLQTFLSDDLKKKIKSILLEEVEAMIPEFLEQAASEMEKRIVFSELVRDKIEAFDSSKIEEILFSVMRSEFKFIEIVGGILGFIIGIIQSIIFIAC